MLILLPSLSREPILLTDPLTVSSPLLSAVSTPVPTSAPSPRPRSPGPVHPFVALPFTFPQRASHTYGGLGKAHGNHNTKSNRNNFKLKVNCYLCKFIGHILSPGNLSPRSRVSPFQPSFQNYSPHSPPPHPCFPGLSHIGSRRRRTKCLILKTCSKSALFCGSNMVVYFS